MSFSGFCGSGGPQSENERKRKEWHILGSFQSRKSCVTWRWQGAGVS